jgi:hypothetical protein
MTRLIAVFFGVALAATTASAATRLGELRKDEVRALIATANTPSQHLRLAQHFEAKAKRFEAESTDHAEMAKLYRARPTASETKRPMSPDTAAHCDYLAQTLSKAANDARALAAAHERMAKE